MNYKNKLLITGASGFLGRVACSYFAQDGWEVYGVTHQQPLDIHGVRALSCDLTDPVDCKALFETVSPGAVLHLAAMSKPDACEQNPQESQRINVDASARLASLCADHQAKLVFTSTDLVFSGDNAPYEEDDPVEPINRYGEQKVRAEEAINWLYPEATIARMPLMFGPGTPRKPSFTEQLVISLQQQKTMHLFTDEYRTVVNAETAVQGLNVALDQPGTTLHLGGKERWSRYAFGQLVAELMGQSADVFQPVKLSDIQTAAHRPADASMNSQRAFQLGYSPASVRDQLKAVLDGLGTGANR
ncbi:MAG: SDR family oxidoreductase [Gammaproteobacteria bacterium]|nr:SDR family oxidoreductase [Gammaproteobacteria bacterium]